MDIKFNPESEKFDGATEEYQKIWAEDSGKIIEVIERISELKFKTTELEAEVYEGISSSHPLRLRASYTAEVKKGTLIHELCHILLSDNEIKFETSEEIHKQINPILYKTWTDLYGKDFANRMVEEESKRSEMYKKAWEGIKE